MAFSDFTLDELKTRFKLTIREDVSLLSLDLGSS